MHTKEDLNFIFARNHNYSIVAIPGIFKTVLAHYELMGDCPYRKFPLIIDAVKYLSENNRQSVAIEEILAMQYKTIIHDEKVIEKVKVINKKILKKEGIDFKKNNIVKMHFSNHSLRNIFNIKPSSNATVEKAPFIKDKEFKKSFHKSLSEGYGVKELYSRIGEGDDSFSVMINSRIIPTIRKFEGKIYFILILQGQVNKVSFKDEYEKRITSMIPKKFMYAFLRGEDVKLLTTGSIVWTDLEGSSKLSVELDDPLEYADIMIRYREAMKGVLFEHGGIFLKSTGDQIIGVIPEHTKDCSGMSVLAGLKMQERHLQFIKEEKKINPKVQIGRNRVVVCTGQFVEIFGGGFNHPEYDINGRIMNKGPRIEYVTPPGEMWIDQETHEKVKHSQCVSKKKIQFKENAPFEGKGVGQIYTYKVVK